MKKFIFLTAISFIFSLTACSTSTSKTTAPSKKTYDSGSYKSYNSSTKSTDSSYKSKRGSSSSGYDYDKGYGYTSPKNGESLGDYIKRQDPDLYNDMKKRYNSLK